MAKLNIQNIYKRPADNFVFFGKLIIIVLYFSRVINTLGHTDLPLVSIFQHNLSSNTYFIIWQVLFFAVSVLVFLNQRPKQSLLILGLLLILALLMNELSYSNNLFFAACMMITLSASNKFYNWVPIQLSIVYFGAFIDKFWFEQWRNGDFMTAFYSRTGFLGHLTPIFDYHFLIMAITYSTLIIELLLSILILIPKTRYYGMMLGLFFHFSTIIFMNDFFGMFIVLILISYFAVVETTINFHEEFRISKLINYLNELKWCYKCKDKIWFRFKLNNKTHDNYKALILSILLNPFTVILLTLFFTSPYLNVKKIVLFILIAIVFIFAFGNKFKVWGKKTLRSE